MLLLSPFDFFFKINFSKNSLRNIRVSNNLDHNLGSAVIKLFSYSTQLSMKFILFIDVKMPTFVGILTFISRINTSSERV